MYMFCYKDWLLNSQMDLLKVFSFFETLKVMIHVEILRIFISAGIWHGFTILIRGYKVKLTNFPEFSLVAGVEAAGVVTAVGPGITGWKVGDVVAYAGGSMGSYSEEQILPANKVVPLPPSINPTVGASIMVKGMTVHYLVRCCFKVGYMSIQRHFELVTKFIEIRVWLNFWMGRRFDYVILICVHWNPLGNMYAQMFACYYIHFLVRQVHITV